MSDNSIRMGMANILQQHPNRVIECGSTLILGDNSDSGAPIDIIGTNNRVITVNGNQIQPTNPSVVFYNFLDGFSAEGNVLNLITTTHPVQFQVGTFSGSPPITSAQVPRATRIRYGNKYQVFLSGTFFYTGGMPSGNFSLATLPNTPIYGELFTNWRPPQNLLFQNGGDIGANTSGLLLEASTGILYNTSGGSFASLDGISYWLDIV